MRRKEARQDYARQKDDEEEEQRKMEDEYYKIQSKVESKRKEEDEERKKREHDEWVQREKDAIEDLKRKKEEGDERKKYKDETETKHRSEWDEREKKGTETRDRKEELLKKEMESLDRQSFHNPERPLTEVANQSFVPTQNLMDPSGIDLITLAMDPRNCKFYLKTGACRFGPKCSRNHLKFNNSTTVLIQNFFQDARLAIPMLNERSNDSSLEYDEVDLIHEFEKFYDDVIGEFRAAGTVVMFKCCQNYVPHLRGNVYVQYAKNHEALEAMRMFNGRFYAGRQLTVELSPVTNWTSSICGLFDKRLCPRGKACNFLHVFRNPGNAYSVPNRTDFDPERAFRSGGYDPSFVNPNHPVFKYYNQRDAYGYRSEDAARSGGYGRNRWDNLRKSRSRSRSRSRDRDRRKRRYSRSRSRSRSHSRGRSRSHSSSRSRSRSRSHRRRHSRSKTRSQSPSRSPSQSRSRSKDRKRSRKHSNSSSSRGSSKKKSSRNNSEISDTSTDWSDLSED